MKNNETKSQKDRNNLVLSVVEVKRLFAEKGYFLFQKPGGSCPMTKCPMCGRIRVAMGLKAENAGSTLHFLDICTGRFDKWGDKHCDYYFKASGDKNKIFINQYGNRSARIIATEEKNVGALACCTNDSNFKWNLKKEVK